MQRDQLAPALRQRLHRLPPPHAAHYGVVPLPPPEHSLEIGAAAADLAEGNAALGRVRALADSMPNQWLISRILTRHEALSSSALEGTCSTLDEVLTFETTQDQDMSAATRQVRDYALALENLVPQAQHQGPTLFSLDLIAHIHRQVMAQDPHYPDPPGAWRTCVVWIGGGGDIAYSSYTPPPPDHIIPCLADTLAYMQGGGMQMLTQGLITRMAVAHAHFEAVHPFRDGNGRVGRLLLPLMLAAEGEIPLSLSPFIAERKADYYDALKQAQQKLNYAPLIGFIARAITSAVHEAEATCHALVRLTDLWSQRRRFRQDSAARRALDLLRHYPIITVAGLAEALTLSRPAAQTALLQLTEAGIVRERTGQRRNRIFVADEAMSILTRPYGAEPILPEDTSSLPDLL